MSRSNKKELPDKLYYSIREVSEHTGIEAHVLRYWEQEFPSLKPKRARSGSRNYRRRDIELIETIRTLLHDKGYRIDGARKHLLEMKRAGRTVQAKPQMALEFDGLDKAEKLRMIKAELIEIHRMLEEMGPEKKKASAGEA